MKQVILDCDGVLLNWKSGFTDWMVENGLFDNSESWPSHDYNFFMHAKLPDGSPFPQSMEKVIMNIFNETHRIERLAPIEGSIQVVERLRREGYIIKVVTSFSDKYEAMRMRENNLINVFGNVFQDIVSLPLRSSKFEYLSKQDKDSYFIDDLTLHVKSALDVGFKPEKVFMVAHDYNTDPKVDNFWPKNRSTWATINRNII